MFTAKIQCLQQSFDRRFSVIPVEVVAEYATYDPLDKLELDLKKLQDIILSVNTGHTTLKDHDRHDNIKFEIVD